MLAIGFPMAAQLEADIYLTIAAALGGGVFGDHCSPISDTTIISSMASASDHIDHVKTQLPYALTAGVLAALLYLVLGLLSQ
jgi:Na+/H+ antiporter NhaC